MSLSNCGKTSGDSLGEIMHRHIGRLTPKMIEMAFMVCDKTAAKIINGRGNRRLLSMNNALKTLPLAIADDLATALVAGTRYDVRHRNAEHDTTLNEISHGVELVTRAADLLQTIDNALSDKRWDKDERAAANARLTQMEDRIHCLRERINGPHRIGGSRVA